ncbi:hypothetical protein SDC9_130190 [bioreactor metagenome]|uniref:Uncharacterized protein n=1 Tax=bioreactor metagenome TaxID=1076179 RepID=A0A645D1M4_9ZZZZ
MLSPELDIASRYSSIVAKDELVVSFDTFSDCENNCGETIDNKKI